MPNLNNNPINSTEESPSWETNSSSASQEIPPPPPHFTEPESSSPRSQEPKQPSKNPIKHNKRIRYGTLSTINKKKTVAAKPSNLF
jgi:hypothetical protein